MIEDTIKKLVRKYDLTKKEMQESIDEIMKGKASPVQISSFLTGSIMKGITVNELAAAAQSMREFSKKVKVKSKVVLDCCGTGGDMLGTFNISTISAFVIAGAGVCVAKHGNRSASGKCGSADLLEALGVKIELDQDKTGLCIEELGIGFMFAPIFHPAMKNVAPIRRELGIRTIFNLLGPLTNPAQVKYQLIGVNDPELLKKFALVLKELGSIHVMVARGCDGLDELAITTKTQICELKNGKIKEFELSASEFGIKKAGLKDLMAKDKNANVRIAQEILEGQKGPRRDIVCFNAGAGLYIAGAVRTIKEGFELANITIDSGRAKEKLRHLIEFTAKVSK